MSLADTIDVAIRAEISQYTEGLRKADDITQRTTNAIEQKFRRLGSTIAALTGGVTIAAVMQQSVRAFSEAEQSALKLDSVLASMGRGTGELSLQLKMLAGQIQSEGIISDDEIIRGQAMLATFDTLATEMLPRATRVMADFAALTGGDARTAALLLGRASAGMTETLARYGIVLSEDVKKSGDFSRVLDEIEKKVGGMNKALGESASGQLVRFRNAWGEVLEAIGSVLTVGISQVIATEDDIRRWGDAVVVTLEFVGDTMDLVSRIFMTAGETIGARLAETTAALKGNQSEALAISQDWERRMQEIWNPAKFSDRRKQYMDELQKGAKFEVKGDFKLRDPKKEKESLEALSAAQKFQNEVFDEYLRELDELTKKRDEVIGFLEDQADPTREMQRELKKINQLYDDGRITSEAWAEATLAAHEKVDQALERTANKAGKDLSELTIFYEQAMKNLQTASANFLERVLLGQVEDFEKEFKAMLARLAAELAASKIMEFLMGKDGKGGVTDAAASAIGNWVSGLFTQGAAMGDTVGAGDSRIVGERGRELFVPKTDGVILSNEELARASQGGGGGVTVTNVFNVSTGVSQTVRAELEQYAPIIEERSRQGVLAAIERGGRYAKAVNRRST